ncbi:MAG: hypothetical protein IEMM0006_1528 [bacterium]|nr:MAG: hypothetical protein IEMM0006_1528 [bacterium]
MRWINIFPLFLLLVAGGVQSREVQITGHTKGFSPGSLVRVLVYADQFSHLEKTLATTRTDSTGNFSLTFPVTQTTYAMLAINLKRTGFYLKPKAVYHFTIAQDSLIRNASPFEDIPLRVSIKAEDDSLNILIGIYNELYNKLIINHFRDIYLSHNRELLRNFEAKVNQRFGQIKTPYLQRYIRYSQASLVWGSRTKSLPEIVAAYFAENPVLYHNRQYTRLFLNFFRVYFESTIKKPVTRDKLARVIPQRNLKKLDALFASDPALSADARVRQLAEMVQLANLYPDPGFGKDDITLLFKQIAAKSAFVKNREIARDYLVKLNILQPGTPAPAFLLPDLTGKEFSLKDFRGKFVLLDFVNTHCPVCNKQLNELANISRELGAGFTNLTIVKGKATPEFMRQANPTGYSWPFLLLGKSILILERYQIVTYPAYVLIDPEGRVAMAPAPMPGNNLQQYIATRINAFKKRAKN